MMLTIRRLQAALILVCCIAAASFPAARAAMDTTNSVVNREDHSPKTGSYKGAFTYDDPGQPVGTFVLTIDKVVPDPKVRDSYKISGTIVEPRSDFGPETPTLSSTFEGSYTLNSKGEWVLSFVKAYDYDKHEVSYIGGFDKETNGIIGKWIIGEVSGAFTLKDITKTPPLEKDVK